MVSGASVLFSLFLSLFSSPNVYLFYRVYVMKNENVIWQLRKEIRAVDALVRIPNTRYVGGASTIGTPNGINSTGGSSQVGFRGSSVRTRVGRLASSLEVE